jgi:3-oxoacyl-(acyl-carrier-protein) synthase III
MSSSFVVNRHGRMVMPSNIIPELDFSTLDTLEQLDRVIRRDFETKAPSGTDIVEKIQLGRYGSRYALLRDLALNLFWANRFAITMYDKRPTRWADVPRTRSDVFLPVVEPWVDGEAKVAAVRTAYGDLPAAWDQTVEDHLFEVLFDVFGSRRHHATTLPAVKPTVAEFLGSPGALTFRLRSYDPDFPVYDYDDILDCAQDVPELEALHRWAMVLHNQYPWDRSQVELVEAADLAPDDHVVVFSPRDAHVRGFLRRLAAGTSAPVGSVARETRPPVRPFDSLDVRSRFTVMPRLEALAAVHGDHLCTNEDVIRNSAYNWSPMGADEIREKTGIESRRYSSLPLEELALQAGEAALAKAGREPDEVGAVLVCTCTSSRLIPSVATYVCGQLGIGQTHAAYDIIAACAGMSYGLAEATRLLQEVQRPVLVICVEKFSDKIGNVRPSRMIFGDGAAAMVVGVAPEGAAPDLVHLQTYASGPESEVNSILWPNPMFDNNITVFGPQVKALAGRYLAQMIDELGQLPDPDGASSLLDSIDLIVPHQANKTMVVQLAERAGLSADQLYFNIETVGNASAASIPLAIHDAVRDGVISQPLRVFAPGFGAGAVAGYAVMRIDPAVVAVSGAPAPLSPSGVQAPEPVEDAPASEGVRDAFG